MHPAEIIVSEVKRECRFVICPTLAKGIRQTGESPVFHSHAEIVSLNMRCAATIHIGVSHDRFFLAPVHSAGLGHYPEVNPVNGKCVCVLS